MDLEHRLVTEHLRIERLRLILGISMGGMHTWMWGIRYPQAMDALVPISSLPAKVDVVGESLDEDDANDILYRFEASFDYDPAAQLGAIAAPLLAILFADDELNPVELGVIDRLIKTVPMGRHVMMPMGPECPHEPAAAASTHAALNGGPNYRAGWSWPHASRATRHVPSASR